VSISRQIFADRIAVDTIIL